MTQPLDVTYGRLLLADLFTQVWLGNWDRYEKIFAKMPEEMKEEFPFHQSYIREDVTLWHENYFVIPGEHFISPYLSSYYNRNEEQEMEKAKRDLLCLIGLYEDMGFYYPLENGDFPDHIGSLTAFLTAAIREEAKALEKNDAERAEKMYNLEAETYEKYIKPNLMKFEAAFNKKNVHPFFQKFVPFFTSALETTVL